MFRGASTITISGLYGSSLYFGSLFRFCGLYDLSVHGNGEGIAKKL
jgi:hypothetical protein